MCLTTDEVQRYLERLGLQPPLPPTVATLSDLIARHIEAIPFENLDVFGGRDIVLTTRGAVEKVIARRRGGFCFEVNEAFRALLSSLGFAVRRIEARVWVASQACFGAPFDHLALVVTLDGAEWLVDVGFGDNNRAPLRLPHDSTSDVSGQYRLRPAERDGELVLERLKPADGAEQAIPLYVMTTAAQALEAFVPMCRYHQTSPLSIFTKGLICTRATPSGRITLTQSRLVATEGSARRESELAGPHELGILLKRHFDIAMETPEPC